MSITQAVENENMLNEKTEYFLQKCGLSDILGASGACRESGLPVVKIARYPFTLVFRSRFNVKYIRMKSGGDDTGFDKDAVCRFKNSIEVNWLCFRPKS